MFYRNFSTCHYRSCNQSSNIKMIWLNRPCCTSEFIYTLYSKFVTANSLNLCTHRNQHITKILCMRFTSSIVNCRLSLCQYRHQNKIFCSSYWWKPLSYICSLQPFTRKKKLSIDIGICCSHLYHIINKHIHRTSTKFTSLRHRHHSLTYTWQQRTRKHYWSLHFLRKRTIYTSISNMFYMNLYTTIWQPSSTTSKHLNKFKHVYYITRLRDIMKSNWLVSK